MSPFSCHVEPNVRHSSRRTLKFQKSSNSSRQAGSKKHGNQSRSMSGSRKERGREICSRDKKRRRDREQAKGNGLACGVARARPRQFVPRRAYRMLIKRVSTVSKYLTAAAARRGATMDRSGAELRARATV